MHFALQAMCTWTAAIGSSVWQRNKPARNDWRQSRNVRETDLSDKADTPGECHDHCVRATVVEVRIVCHGVEPGREGCH